MNRTNICKMIIQFIKDYITDPTKYSGSVVKTKI